MTVLQFTYFAMNRSADSALIPAWRSASQLKEARHGPVLTGYALATALGLCSGAALRQARRHGHISVPLLPVSHRTRLMSGLAMSQIGWPQYE